MKKRKKSLKKKFDIYQKSFSFTHRYNAEKFALDKIKLLKNNFALKINNRLILASIIFSSLFIAVTIKMIEINLFYVEKGKLFVSSEIDERGNIYDRNNSSLTANLLTSHISINPKKIYDKERFISKVSGLNTMVNAKEIRDSIEKGQFFWIKKNAGPAEIQKFIDLGETGIEFHDVHKRKYLHSELFSHLIGKVDLDNEGISGIEKSYNYTLKSEAKKDLVTSLDLRVQYIVRDEIISARSCTEHLAAQVLLWMLIMVKYYRWYHYQTLILIVKLLKTVIYLIKIHLESMNLVQ